MSNAHKELYEFDKFRLDVSERILWRETERVPLSEKAFETLVALVRRGNHLVGKDELLAEVWTDAIVEENNLDKNISILRRVLGEREGRGKFIETVRGHGYRFVAPVQDSSAEPQTPAPVEAEIEPLPLNEGSEDLELEIGPENLESNLTDKSEAQTPKPGPVPIQNPKSKIQNRTVYAFAALIFLIAVAAGFYFWRPAETKDVSSSIKTIAVLPFKSLDTGNRNEALELAMADTLISKLGGTEIIVRPLGSVRRYVAAEQDPVNAGRELGVETVLDGTIQTADNRIRISAKLFRMSDGKQLWTGQFDEKFTDIFVVQDAISERVATALKITLGGKQKKHYTENVEAYQFYMKGRFHLLKGIRSETEIGISYFGQAIEADPNYALAYAGLADAYRGLAVGGETPSAEAFPKAKAAAVRAIALDETLAEAHANLGHIIFWYDWDWAAAEAEHKRALELDPNSADTLQFYAHLLSNIGRHPEALEKIKRARELDPLNLRINALEGLFLLHAGQTAEAIARLEETLELDSNYRLANMFAARAYSEKGMFAEALAATAKARGFSAESSEPIAFGAYALARSGRLSEARAALDELLKLAGRQYIPSYNIALVYNALGESAKALDYLEKSFSEKDVRMVFLKVEPKWNNLRNEPRFIDLMRRMNFE
jgi:DNA-binding winged helix-turn-helix (wHTH) protein/TolB-like protein/tetratricopeptide (TPR) repeat protein